MKYSLGISNFLEEIASLFYSVVFLFLCILHLRRVSHLSLLFFGTLHSNEHIFPFLLCLSLLFFFFLKTRLPINKTEDGTVWSLISKACGTENTGRLLFAQFLPNSEKAEPFTTTSDSLTGPPRHLTCFKWNIKWEKVRGSDLASV